MNLEILLLLVAVGCTQTESAKILGLWNFFGRSHFFAFESLMKGLAARGHQVTVVSHFPQKTPIPNYIDLPLDTSVPRGENSFSIDDLHKLGLFGSMKLLFIGFLDACKQDLEHPNMKGLLDTKETYDLIITEQFSIDCSLGFMHKLNIPLILLSSSKIMPWGNAHFGNPDNPSYIPIRLFPSDFSKSFTQRVVNTLQYLILKAVHCITAERATNHMMKTYFGSDCPTVSELGKNVSLLLVNTHVSIDPVRPLVQNIVEVAGLHIEESKPLPKELQEFMDKADNGVVLFTFGSVVKGESLSEDKLNAFIKVFSELPQRIVWKCDRSKMPELPANIYTSTWLPQFDILSHQKTKVFITHGGSGGTTEAIDTAVPMLGILLFAEQQLNVQNGVRMGFAVMVKYEDISETTLRAALNELLTNTSYKKKIEETSQLFRDRPQTPMETAVYWVEYVLRHKGAPHLRSAAAQMPHHQYLLLDVIAMVALALILFLALTYFSARTVLRLTFRKITRKGKKE